MKGLMHVPTRQELKKSYLALEQRKIKCAEVVLWSQWSRLDARLAELLVRHLARHWKEFSPIEINQDLLKSTWPAALGVLISLTDLEISREERDLFRAWSLCALTSVPQAPGELFFIGTRAPGGKLALQDALLSLKLYKRWGYFGRDPLNSKLQKNRDLTHLGKKARLSVLKVLLKKKGSISVKQYRTALNLLVSKRTAELDLQNYGGIRPVGKTKGRTYTIAKRKKN